MEDPFLIDIRCSSSVNCTRNQAMVHPFGSVLRQDDPFTVYYADPA